MEYLTIRKEAKASGIPEFRLRKWVKQGCVPGFWAGTRFYVAHERLMERLERICTRQAGGE